MGVFDFPLSKLKTYEGINPKPADFEEYWERGLREIETIDPQVQLTPAAFCHPTLDCFDLTFTGAHGARIHAKYVRPKNFRADCLRSCVFMAIRVAPEIGPIILQWPARALPWRRWTCAVRAD